MLDEKKSYESMHGDPLGYKFRQGDRYFREDGYECTIGGKQIEFPVVDEEADMPQKTYRLDDIDPGAVNRACPPNPTCPPNPSNTPKKRGRPRKQ